MYRRAKSDTAKQNERIGTLGTRPALSCADCALCRADSVLLAGLGQAGFNLRVPPRVWQGFFVEKLRASLRQ